jgi:phage shock protein A
VALAAIQGLDQKLNAKDAEIQNLKQQNDSLAERLNELEATVKQLAANK